MHPLAHHAGEEALVPLLLVAGSWLPVLAAMARDRLVRGRRRGAS